MAEHKYVGHSVPWRVFDPVIYSDLVELARMEYAQGFSCFTASRVDFLTGGVSWPDCLGYHGLYHFVSFSSMIDVFAN